MLVFILTASKNTVGDKGLCELYNSYCAGNNHALGEIFRRLHGLNFHTAHSILLYKVKEPEEIALDMIQDVVVTFLKRPTADRVKLSKDGEVKGLIRKSVKWRTLSFLRKKSNSEQAKDFQNIVLLESEARNLAKMFQNTEIEERLTNAEIWICIENNLSQLELNIFKLYLLGYNHKEIAVIVEIEYDLVRKILYSARKKIIKKCIKSKKI